MNYNSATTELKACEHGGQIATVTLDNRDRLNTLNPDLIESATTALRKLAANDDLRAVVLTGFGDRAFVGGADVRYMVELDAPGARRFITSLHELFEAVLAIPVPVIGRINGYALGAGMELAACCDYRIAVESAEFGMPEVHVGIPSVIEAVRLPMLIGWGRTRELLLTGRWIDAAEAERIGLVEQCVSLENLDSAVLKSIDLIARAGPKAVRDQKALIDRWESLELDAGVQAGIDAFEAAMSTDEPARYMQAFLNRKKRT